MSKVHISLVGGQAAPVYYGIAGTNPDIVVFVHSLQTSKVVDSIKKELGDKIVTGNVIMGDSYSPEEIKLAAENIADKFVDDEVTVNISGGMKPWSHFFGIVFQNNPNATIIYVDQNNILWDYKKMTSKQLDFDMHQLFRLYGNPLENYKNINEYTKEDFDLINVIKKARNYNYDDFKALTSLNLSKADKNKISNKQSGEVTLPSGSSIKWFKDENGLWTVSLYLLKKDKPLSFEFTSPNVLSIVFFSGWFELSVAKFLSNWDKACDVYLNCHFPFVKNVDKNEVDIIVNTGKKLLFVECKTQITSSTDIDKFRSVVKCYGGTASKGIFITDAKMNDMACEKCDQQGLLHYSLSDDHQTQYELLYMLNYELNNTNEK